MLQKLEFSNDSCKELVISSLKEVNTLRNKLAHEAHFNIEESDLTPWASRVLTT